MAAPLSSDDRRAQILDVRLLESEPFDSLSMDRVATEAGVSSPLLFHYFKNKNGFRRAVLEASAKEFQRRVEPDLEQPLFTQLRAGIETFVAMVTAHPTLYLAMIQMASSGDDDMRTIYRGQRRALTDRIVSALAGIGAPPTPALAALVQGWQAFMEEVVLSWLDDQAMERADMIDLCERAFYHLLPAAGLDADQHGGFAPR